MTVADLFRAIKRHWILEIILFVVTVGAVAGFTFTATPHVFRSDSTDAKGYRQCRCEYGPIVVGSGVVGSGSVGELY